MYCSNCGKIVPEDSRFCEYCGYDLREDEISPEYQKPSGSSELPRRPGRSPESGGAGRNRSPRRKPAFLRVLFAVLGCAVIILAVHGQIKKNRDGNKTDSSGTVVSSCGILALGKGFTKKPITNEKTAIKVAREAADDLGLKNALNDLTDYVNTTTIDGTTYYRLQQNYRGIPVYGKYVIVAADKDGKALALSTDASDIPENVKTKATVTDEQLETTVRKYLEENEGSPATPLSFSGTELVIYAGEEENQARAALRFTVSSPQLLEIVADAETGEVLSCVDCLSDLETGPHMSGKSRNSSEIGTDVDRQVAFPIYKVEKTYYMGENEDERIRVYTLDGEISQWKEGDVKKSMFESEESAKRARLIKSGDAVFGDTIDEDYLYVDGAGIFLNTIISIRDYYMDHFHIGLPYGCMMLFSDDGFDDGKNALGGCLSEEDIQLLQTMPGDENYKRVSCIFLGSFWNGDESDVLAHEYLHAVAYFLDSAVDDGDSGVQEGLADTFSCFYNGIWSFPNMKKKEIIGSDRSASDPSAARYPVSLDDPAQNCPEDNNHKYATVVSHAAWMMAECGEFTMDELEQLWYHTLQLLPHKCNFDQLRSMMELAAENRECSDAQKDVIGKVFDQVGVRKKTDSTLTDQEKETSKQGSEKTASEDIYALYQDVVNNLQADGTWSETDHLELNMTGEGEASGLASVVKMDIDASIDGNVIHENVSVDMDGDMTDMRIDIEGGKAKVSIPSSGVTDQEIDMEDIPLKLGSSLLVPEDWILSSAMEGDTITFMIDMEKAQELTEYLLGSLGEGIDLDEVKITWNGPAKLTMTLNSTHEDLLSTVMEVGVTIADAEETGSIVAISRLECTFDSDTHF